MLDRKEKLGRRVMLAGAGTVGALAAAAVVMPAVQPSVDAKADSQQSLDGQAAGYRLTEHIKRYYRSTRI